MTIKKDYIAIVEFLKANQNKKVSSILAEIESMTSAKQSSKNFKVDEAGQVTHIFCYYHKKWEPVGEVEFGAKKHSASGFNSMCKEGVNQWSKQQRDYKKAKDDAMQALLDGKIDQEELKDLVAKAEADKNRIEPRSDEIGYDEL